MKRDDNSSLTKRLSLHRSALRELIGPEVQSESQADTIVRVVEEVVTLLVRQGLAVQRADWLKASQRADLVTQLLSDVYKRRDNWSTVKLLGVPVLKAMWQVNQALHHDEVTRGASRYKAAIVKLQGGEFCAVCGARENLVVDHILPVRSGGDAHHLSNMQLLCVRCNSGKLEYADAHVPLILTTHKTTIVSARVRYKVLSWHLEKTGDRWFGRCPCGRSVRTNQLEVELRNRASLANITNLVVRCDSSMGPI